MKEVVWIILFLVEENFEWEGLFNIFKWFVEVM